MAHSEGTTPSLLHLWTVLAAAGIGILSVGLSVVAMVNPDVIKEYTASIIAILFVIGAGYLQVEQPTIDHSVIWAIVGSIVGVYFGAKVNPTTTTTTTTTTPPPAAQPPSYVPPTLKG